MCTCVCGRVNEFVALVVELREVHADATEPADMRFDNMKGKKIIKSEIIQQERKHPIRLRMTQKN
jgi:hypothetical protein